MRKFYNMEITSLLPLISSIITIFLGFFVFLTNKESKVNKLFLFFSMSISLGLFSTFMMFENSGDVFTILFWDKMVYVGVVFIPVAMYHFGLTILNKKEKYTKILLLLGYATAIFFLLIIPTDLFISDVFIYEWGAHTKAQFFHHLFLVYFFSYLLLWLSFMYKGYKLETLPEEKTKLRLVFVSFLILTGVGSFGFLPAYEISIYPFSYISGIIFVVILSYAILRHHLFDIKLILVELAILLLNLFLFLNVFTSHERADLILNVSVSAFILAFSIILIRGIYKDIRDRERIEELAYKMEVSNEKLRMMEGQKTEFVSIASHQLRTPLTVIKGYASMVLEGTFGTINDSARDAMEKLYKSSERIVALVEDLLTVSRIEQGRMMLALETVNYKDFVQATLAEMEEEVSEAKIDMSFTAEEEKEFFVAIDEKKFKQAVRHILENAIEYTPASGSVRVVVEDDSLTKKIRLTISDTGVGMTAEQIADIFERFNLKADVLAEQGEGINEKKEMGGLGELGEQWEQKQKEEEVSSKMAENKTPGIGLYIAQEIIEAHHGTLRIESAGKDRGTTVVVELPRVGASEEGRI